MVKMITKKCETCGHSYKYPACPECDGAGSKPPSLESGEAANTGFQFTPCRACHGTGIKGGRVFIT